MDRRVLIIIGGVIVVSAVATGALLMQPREERLVPEQQKINRSNTMSTLQLSSSAFEQNATIPKKYTCQGEGVNPPLSISGAPEGTKTLALIMDDPDAPMGVWDHWVMWNILPDITSIAENSVPGGAVLGSNSSGKNEYQGPCPPSGTHRYRFSVYAVFDILSLKPGSTKAELLNALTGGILGQYTLVGLYQKS